MYENGKIYMGLAGDKRVELTLNMRMFCSPQAPLQYLPGFCTF